MALSVDARRDLVTFRLLDLLGVAVFAAGLVTVAALRGLAIRWKVQLPLFRVSGGT